MDLRLGIQEHIPENAAEAIKVLILTPASGRPFENLYSQTVAAFLKQLRHIKLRRRKAVLAVSRIASVDPQGKAALHSLERENDALAFHPLRNFKEADIARGRIVMRRDFPRLYAVHAVPGILGIYISRPVIPMHLNMAGHRYFIPSAHIKIFRVKSGYRFPVILRIREFPASVQQKTRIRLPLTHFSPEEPVIRVGGKAVLHKYFGILYDLITKFTHGWLLYLSYL